MDTPTNGDEPKGPSRYELRARGEIAAWRSPEKGPLDGALDLLTWPFAKTADVLVKLPGLGWTLEKTIGGLVRVANDAAQWSVRSDAILARYRKSGHADVHTLADVHALDLEDVDREVRLLARKYRSLALSEGACLGALGIPGMPLDVVALVTLSLRAIGEHATYCGFDIALPGERLFVANVLALATSPVPGPAGATLGQLTKLSKDVAKKRALVELEKYAVAHAVEESAKVVGRQFAKAKLAQLLPAAGALVAGGFNAHFIGKVCRSASFLYRERFLDAKYGSERGV